MIEITWQYDPDAPVRQAEPATAEEAIFSLQRGNRAFADLGRDGGHGRYVIPVAAEELGFGQVPGIAPQQTPSAALLGCADARVPLELVFSQSANDVFAVRVAGNVLDGACVGSIDFAISNLPTVRAIAVVGHTGCGAVRAAMDAYLEPASYLGLSANLPLRGIVDAVTPAVRAADTALRAHYGPGVVDRPGFPAALLDASVVLNAGIAADAVRRMFAQHLHDGLGVAFGVYDLASRLVGLPDQQVEWHPGLFAPPEPQAAMEFVEQVVTSVYIRSLLGR